MKPELNKLITEYSKIEEKIWKVLQKLSCFKGVCNCEDEHSIDLTEPETGEAQTLCLECGGEVQ
ncbi:MAG: hypothetical protein GY861_17280 [bacterium]|nr:hypothetical protein [bacterium]